MLIRDLIAQLTALADAAPEADEPDVFVEAPRGLSRVASVRRIDAGESGFPRVAIAFVDPPHPAQHAVPTLVIDDDPKPSPFDDVDARPTVHYPQKR